MNSSIHTNGTLENNDRVLNTPQPLIHHANRARMMTPVLKIQNVTYVVTLQYVCIFLLHNTYAIREQYICIM